MDARPGAGLVAMERFDTSKDPRFKRAPRHVRRVQVDGRFARMFKDKQFVETPQVDSRGQRLSRKAGKQKLQEFYDLAGVETDKGISRKDQAELDSEADLPEELEEESAVEAMACRIQPRRTRDAHWCACLFSI